jgi:hypothetical protein
MDNTFALTNRTYEAIDNLHTMQESFKMLRFIDGDLSDYARTFLKLGVRKSGSLVPTQLDEILGFHSSLRNQIILDPFSCARHQELFEQNSKIELSNLVNSHDLEILKKMSSEAIALMKRDKIPSLEFLLKIIGNFEGSLLITFRREATVNSAQNFLKEYGVRNVFVDCLHRRHESFADNNLIFGPIHWFHESVLTSPRGTLLFAMAPAHIKFKLPEMTSFPDWFNFGKVPLFRDLDSSMLVLNSDDSENVDEFEHSVPIRWISGNSSNTKTSDNQKLCRQIALANGKQVFIDVDGEEDFVNSVEIDHNNLLRKIEIATRDLKIGDFIILREGQSDAQALYMKARDLIGPKIDQIEIHQHEWKSALKALLLKSDIKSLNRTLRDKGMKSVNRLSDWTDPNLRRPLRDDDFAIILNHLNLDVNKYMNSATLLKRTILQVAVNFRNQLTATIESLSGDRLRESGTQVISSPVDGIANLFISKVVGVSAEERFVESQKVRVPFDNGENS